MKDNLLIFHCVYINIILSVKKFHQTRSFNIVKKNDLIIYYIGIYIISISSRQYIIRNNRCFISRLCNKYKLNELNSR